MTKRDPEALGWALSSVACDRNEGEASELSDETLRAYQDGRLSEPDAAEVERLLADSRRARARLNALAQVELPSPDSDLRATILGQAPAPRRPKTVSRRWMMGLAAAVVLGVGLTWSLIPPDGIPQGLSYNVGCTGLATTRAGEVATGAVEGYPDTPIRIALVPRSNATAGLAHGLYQIDRGRLRRLDVGDQIKLQTDRGTAIFTARAADLVGASPGVHAVIIAVAQPDDLPDVVPLDAEQDPGLALAASGRRLVYVQDIKILRRLER